MQRRDELEKRRDRLTLAASAMASIHVAPTAPAPVAPTAGSVTQTSTARSASPGPGKAAASPQKAGATTPGLQRMNFVVNNGQFGIGTVVQLDADNRLTVGGFRTMPDGSVNPSQKAGILVGDIIDAIAGENVTTIEHIKRVLSGRKGNVSFSVLRKK
jgi:membrane-associated protease RseP (regulator of RpoE activity)